MCASVFPLTCKNIEGVFGRNVSSDTCTKRVLKRMVATVAVSDKDPLKRGASFECRLVKGNAGGTLRYEQWPQSHRIYPSEYLRSQGFGPRELATLEVADSATIAGQLAFELNLPNSGELAKAVEDIITAAKKESSMLIRTGGTLANDLAWTQLAGKSWSLSGPRSSRLSTTAWTPIGRTSCCPVRQGPRHSSATSPCTSGGGYG